MAKEIHDDSFRDSLSTVDSHGKRKWVYPRKPAGPFHRARVGVAFLLVMFFVAAPFIKLNGQPLLLLNIIERKFVIFGMVFWPQDFHLFVLAMIAAITFLLLFTVIYGRVWCGWACPQTIFMEFVFRKIEYLIEGDAASQRALAKQAWTGDKLFKKISKHTIFFGLSFLIGNLFLAYIIGVDNLWQVVIDPPEKHAGGLAAMVIFSGVFYFVFAWFREQVCTIVCPYGRLQGVLLDKNSIAVSYDHVRGEPRMPVAKAKDNPKAGDCIECMQCVRVCPTGIDIRNGTQLECINCTACIDACDHIMDSIGKPRGLIRYASYNSITEQIPIKLTGRIVGYSLVLLSLIGLVSVFLFNRSDVETTILRTPGTLFQETEDGSISNLYSYKIVNKTFDEIPLQLHLTSPVDGILQMVGDNTVLAPQSVLEGVFFIKIPKHKLKTVNTPVELKVLSHNTTLETVQSTFIGPNPFKKNS